MLNKYLIFSIVTIFVLAACAPTQQTQEGHDDPKEEVVEKTEEKATVPADSVSPDGMSFHGMRISSNEATPLAEFAVAGMSEGVKLSGEVIDVCQAKGCWMTLKKADGTPMRVTFKDYGFFVPKDASGKTAIIEGTAMIDTTSIEELRHYAEDGGMDPEEAAKKYTEPEVSLSFIASGVIIK
ncbi:MAG: DUF4920 domain-containing protein [Bacteroidota bacterium]